MRDDDVMEHISKLVDSKNVVELNARKAAELEYHNRVRDYGDMETLDRADYEKLCGNKKYYSTASKSQGYVSSWIERYSPGSIFLDYACGDGHLARHAASAGSKASIGIDISDVSIENCKESARIEGLAGKTYFYQGDCENTQLPDDSVDVVICSGMLHHLELKKAFPELKRILRKGGRVLAVEALNYNPIIRMYRALTPAMRTEWEKEHILSHGDLDLAREFFRVDNIRYWHLASILGTPFRGVVVFSGIMKALNGIDSLLLRIPLIRNMAWMFTFELIKE
jgi:SAM-dependent methyltransferase